ncbi:N-acetylmuramoyl-L-alanine amidase [bacterium C-53]|nr:N-acetylmuramoyl-L-alanine amidase [Lachnospiraceae bacterium]NBI04308.1 N-acetylmuramoyl-L-alanine amidase [Lachnospiraceae bacterium]RKJ08476.1 N-acetylmuramoyl-L-alanine amidase [bacterium C-53]
MEQKKKEIILGAIVLAAIGLITVHGVRYAQTMRMTKEIKTVVIDAGHGGADPGKVGVNQALEKDINLSIAKLVSQYLQQNDIHVIMTRESDTGLNDEGVRNKKVQDLKRRLQKIEESGAVFAVSIHQNSYHEEGVKGAQVFYHGSSEAGKKLADILQDQLITGVDPDNRRVAKANTSYYLLKETTVPTVIVECGFLSNWEEAALLIEEEYQEKMAWNIALGIMRYLNESKSVV